MNPYSVALVIVTAIYLLFYWRSHSGHRHTIAAVKSQLAAVSRIRHDRFGKVIMPYGGAKEIERRRVQLSRGIIYRNHERSVEV